MLSLPSIVNVFHKAQRERFQVPRKSQKRLVVEWNRLKIGRLIELVNLFKDIFGSIRCICLKMTCTQKWPIVQQSGLKFRTEEYDTVGHVWRTFDLAVFKAVWGSFDAHSSVAWKREGLLVLVERNGLKFVTGHTDTHKYGISLTI